MCKLFTSGGDPDRNRTCDVVALLVDFVCLERASTLLKNLSFRYLLFMSRQARFPCE
jgi:hypothetical protein